MEKKRVYIWGAGKYLDSAYEAINKELCIVVGVVDWNKDKWNLVVFGELSIKSPDILQHEEWDFVLISIKNYQRVLKECALMGIEKNKIIAFWKLEGESHYVNYKVKRILELEEEVEQYKWKLENLPYELGVGKVPCVKSAKELLKVIVEKGCSLCRFGDGEFEIMRGLERPWFQNVDDKLSKRLKEIIKINDGNVVVAIADDFGCLDCYTEQAANAIRQYLYGDTRKEIMKFLDFNRIYYDAYVSRPYMIYKDKRNAKKVFDMFKKIWNKRDLLIVEGENSKMGVQNNLFANANKIRRIICPEKNAFDHYERIFSCIKKIISETELVIISLGPTATVLAYDLAEYGVQALDIGQLDNEYEWFLRKAEERIPIPGKGVAELVWWHQSEEIRNQEYDKQIIEKIGI